MCGLRNITDIREELGQSRENRNASFLITDKSSRINPPILAVFSLFKYYFRTCEKLQLKHSIHPFETGTIAHFICAKIPKWLIG